MKKSAIAFCAVITLCNAASVTAQELTGRQLIEKINAVMTPSSTRGIMTQTIETSSGQLRTFRYEYFAADDGASMVMRYTAPRRARGQAFLMLNNADDIWAYFPRTKRVRKLASHAKKQKVQGSDFTYEDMGSGSAWLEEYSSRRLDDEEIDGVICYTVELTPEEDEDPTYSKMVIWADISNLYPVRIDYYEESEAPEKRLSMEDIRVIDGFPTAMRMVMHNLKDDSQTVMGVEEISYNVEFEKSLFTEYGFHR